MRFRHSKLPGPYGREPTLREEFLSVETVRMNGFTLHPASTGGSPPVDRGMTLNGSDQYALLSVNKTRRVHQGGKSDELTVVVEFIPHFNYTEDANRTLVDTDSNGTYRTILIKYSSGGGYYLSVYAGAATLVADIPPATYGPLWLQNQRNVLVCALKSGSNSVYLNGTSIASTVTSWTKYPLYDVWVGSRIGGTASYFFDGVINRLLMFNRKLTPAECSALWTKGRLS